MYIPEASTDKTLKMPLLRHAHRGATKLKNIKVKSK